MTKCNHARRLAVLAATVAATVIAGPALAQLPLGKPMLVAQPRMAEFDASALTRLQPIQTRYNTQILQAFKGNEALKAQMETELKAIAATTDPARKRAMIAAYQKQYGPRYKSILAAGKVDLNAAAREMSAVSPAMKFDLRDGMFLNAVKPTKAAPTVTAQATSSSPPTLAPTEVRTLSGSDYTFRKERSCSNIAGGDVVRSGGYMRAEAFSLVGGGCDSEGTMTYDFTLAENQSVEIALTFDMSAETFAVAVVGSSYGLTSSSVNVGKLNNRGEFIADFNDIFYESNYCSSFAMLLMSDSDECGLENAIKTGTINQPGRYRLIARTYSSALAAIAGSNAKSELKQLRATLTFKPK